jgi:HK97 family phage major capsid protein
MKEEKTKTEEQKTLTMEEFETKLTDTVEKTIRDMGLDKVDRKHGVFPTKDDPEGDGLKDLSKEQRVMKFLQAMVGGDTPTIKALSEGTSADGGYLVPTEFRNTIIDKLYKESVIRQRATVIPMASDKMDVPKAGNNVNVYWTAENTAFTESNPTFDMMTLNTNKLTGLSKMSRELFADIRINLIDYIATIFARGFKQEEDKVFLGGDGTGKPKGIRTYTITNVAQAAGTLAADDFIKLFYALPSQYRSKATWLVHNDVILKARLLKDSQGRYIWTDGFADAAPTILGRPVVEQNDIPVNLGAGTNESEVFLGDLSYYLIGDREEIGVETTTVGAGAFETHQVAFKTWERIDGQLGLTDAFRKLTAVK